MIGLGVIVSRLQIKSAENSYIYVVHVGEGILKYLLFPIKFDENQIVLYEDLHKSNDICYIGTLEDYKWAGLIPRDLSYNMYATSPDYENKTVAFSNKFVLWNRYASDNSINYIGQLLLFSHFYKELLDAIRKEYLDDNILSKIILEVTDYVDSLNIPEIIDSIEVKIQNASYTQRGSDNYIHSWTYMLSDNRCFFTEKEDTYLSNLLPSINILLSSYNEKSEEEYINPLFPVEENWKKDAQNLTNSIKAKALNLFLNKYRKNKHIAALINSQIEYRTKHYYSMKEKLESNIMLSKLFWSSNLYSKDLDKIKENPLEFKNIIDYHNKSTDNKFDDTIESYINLD